MKGFQKVIAGNRLSVPKALPAKHFFYRTSPVRLDEADVEFFVSAVKAQMGAGSGSEVETFRPSAFPHSDSTRIREIYAAIEERMRTAVTMPDSLEIVCCQWTGLHVDEQFFGDALHSTVLHTGPSPYVVETVTTRKAALKRTKPGTQSFQFPETTTAIVRKGDTFVFDPCTPHMAVPKFPHQESLIILAQMRLRDNSREERLKILEALPVVSGPHDEESI